MKSQYLFIPTSMVVAIAILVGCGGSDSPVAEAPAPAPTVTTVPILDSWRTDLSGRYARVQETRTTFPVTRWPAANLTDTSGPSVLPTYSDVQRVRQSDNFVYIDASGMASHQMGPWYWNIDTLFGNWPRSRGFIYKLPKTPIELPDDSRVAVGQAPQGVWVNGVPLFTQLDGASFEPTQNKEIQDGAPANNAARIWIRDAVPVEGPTFDASNAHQPPVGAFHYHSNPLALRLQLGDNVKWNAGSGKYEEDTTKLRHSPILGWAFDGYPFYGPYGYGNCSGTGSEVRRMRSGFVLRDGSSGSSDLRTTGRKSIGKWAALVHGVTTTADAAGRVDLPTTSFGPDVNAYYYLGRYIEDHEFLGDLGKPVGGDYDLDRHNGRFCVTPEFPNGTYAYFITIDADGKAAFPYAVGRQFRGQPQGASVTAATITETLTTYKQGTSTAEVDFKVTLDTPSKRVLEWVSAEGASYVVESSTDGAVWTVLATNIIGTSPAPDTLPGGAGYFSFKPQTTAYIDNRAVTPTPMYRINRPALAPNATAVAPALKGVITAVTPAAVTRGQSVRLEMTLSGNQPITDNDPLASVQPAAFELVTTDGLTVLAGGTNVTRKLTKISADFVIPPTAVPSSTIAPVVAYMLRVKFNVNAANAALQGEYRSVGQTTGLAAPTLAPGVVYTDRPVVVN
jgi:YHYH protein